MSKSTASTKSTRVGHQTKRLYQDVIDDTVARVKGDFVQEGIAEDILDELRKIWGDKLASTGVYNVPEEPSGEEEKPHIASPPLAFKQEPGLLATYGLIPPQMPLPQVPAPAAGGQAPRPAPQVLQSNAQPQPNYMQYPHLQQQFAVQQQQIAMQNQIALAMQQQQQRQQQQYMNAGAWPMQGGAQFTQEQVQQYQQAMLAAAASQAQHRQMQMQQHPQNMQPQMPPAGYAMQPQQMGSAQAPQTGSSLAGQKRSLEDTGITAVNPTAKQLNTGANGQDTNNNPTIPQQDGPADDGVAPESVAADDGEDGIGPGDSGDELNEDDDLADVDDHEEIDEELIKDVMLGQFEKVHRSKAKWKVNLKNCVATINGVDYLLKKVTGEMNF